MGRAGDNGNPLTARQQEVLALIADGLTNREISQQLGVSTSTVKRAYQRAADAMGAATVESAVAFADVMGWLDGAPKPDQRERPLAEEHPRLALYLAAFDRWIASRKTDEVARNVMDAALWGRQSKQHPQRKEDA
jgi:DNA-binding CsgD family transcriptional regulator